MQKEDNYPLLLGCGLQLDLVPQVFSELVGGVKTLAKTQLRANNT